MTTETTAPSATAPSATPRPVRLLKKSMRGLVVSFLVVVPLIASTAGLILRTLSRSDREALDAIAATPSSRALFLLMLLVVVVAIVNFVKGCIDAAFTRTLIGSGMTRREVGAYYFMRCLVHSAAVFLAMLLAVVVTCAFSGDFSGRIVIDGQDVGSLWLTPLWTALVAPSNYLQGAFTALLFVKFRTYTALAFTALLFSPLISLFFADDSAGGLPEFLAEAVTPPMPETLWTLADVVLFLLLSWLILRRLPVRR